MTWIPSTPADFAELLGNELAACSPTERAAFMAHAIESAKWTQSPWGDAGGGFWAIAQRKKAVLWYNDIEEGFQVSAFDSPGAIPENQYWCSQDDLAIAIRRLVEL